MQFKTSRRHSIPFSRLFWPISRKVRAVTRGGAKSWGEMSSISWRGVAFFLDFQF